MLQEDLILSVTHMFSNKVGNSGVGGAIARGHGTCSTHDSVEETGHILDSDNLKRDLCKGHSDPTK